MDRLGSWVATPAATPAEVAQKGVGNYPRFPNRGRMCSRRFNGTKVSLENAAAGPCHGLQHGRNPPCPDPWRRSKASEAYASPMSVWGGLPPDAQAGRLNFMYGALPEDASAVEAQRSTTRCDVLALRPAWKRDDDQANQ